MNIENASFEFNCPECGFINTTTLSLTVNGGSMICVGCLRNINFVDDEGSTKRAMDEVKQAVNNIGSAFK